MKLSFSYISCGLTLLITVLLPPLGYMTAGASSMSSGVFFVSCFYIFFYFVYSYFLVSKEYKVLNQSASVRPLIYITGILAIFVLVHSAVISSIQSDLNISRLLKSLLFLVVFCLGAWAFVRLSFSLPDRHFDFAVRFVFYSLVIASLFALLGFSPFAPEAIKPVFFFAEPSHFALSFLPFFLYLVVTSSGIYKILLIVLGPSLLYL